MSDETANALSGVGRVAPMLPRMSGGSKDTDEDGDFARIMDSLPKPDAAPVRTTRSNKADDHARDASDDYAQSDNDVGNDAERAGVQAEAQGSQKSSDKSLDDDQKIKKNKDKKFQNAEVIEPAPVAIAVAPVTVPTVMPESAPTSDAGNKMAVQVAAVVPSAKPVPAPVTKSDPAAVLQIGEGDVAADPALAKTTVQPALPGAEGAGESAVPEQVQKAIKAALANGQPGKIDKAQAAPKAVAAPHVSSKPIVDAASVPVSKEAVVAPEAAVDAQPRAGEATALIQLANDRPRTTRPDAPAGDVTVNSKTGEGSDFEAASVPGDAASAAVDGKRKPVLPTIAAKLSSFANLVRGNREAQDSAPAMMPVVVKSGALIASEASAKVEEADSALSTNGIGQSGSRMADATAALGGSVPSTPSAAAPATGAAPAAGVGLALGQQVVDMGISGRWIDDIARQIATVAANPGQGSFQLASQTLGAVRVDIVPGTNGSDIMMSVENEAAHAALSNDRQRLLQDAQLASVRLGDVQITRVVSLADAQRGDMNNQNQGQGGANGQAAQSALSQNPQGQGGQQARGDMGLNGQGAGGQGQSGAKAQQSRTVLNDGTLGRATSGGDGRADSARYA